MSELVSSENGSVVARRSFRERYLAMPLPLYRHLIYLGLALNAYYIFVGYSCVIAVEEMKGPDSRAGAFFMVTALPFWTGVVLSFRQYRLLWQYYTNVWEWVIVIISHIAFLYYAPLFVQFWFGLTVGLIGLLFFMPFSLLSIVAFFICIAGRDPVLKE